MTFNASGRRRRIVLALCKYGVATFSYFDEKSIGLLGDRSKLVRRVSPLGQLTVL